MNNKNISVEYNGTKTNISDMKMSEMHNNNAYFDGNMKTTNNETGEITSYSFEGIKDTVSKVNAVIEELKKAEDELYVEFAKLDYVNDGSDIILGRSDYNLWMGQVKTNSMKGFIELTHYFKTNVAQSLQTFSNSYGNAALILNDAEVESSNLASEFK